MIDRRYRFVRAPEVDPLVFGKIKGTTTRGDRRFGETET